MEALSVIFGKISNYNILNNLIPGAILCVVFKYLVGYDLMTVGTIELIIIFYFAGMINSRIGSLIVDWIMRITKFVSYRDHHLFLAAEQKDAKLNSLVEVNNMYRSIISIAFTSLMVKLYHIGIDLSWEFGNVSEWLLLLALLFLFAFAYKKQTKFIVNRIDYLTRT